MNIITHLLSQEFGLALPARVSAGQEILTSILIHEDSAHIPRVSNPDVHMIASCIALKKDIKIVVLFIEIEQELYEIYLNWHVPQVNEFFTDLSNQTKLIIQFFNTAPSPDRSIEVPNVMQMAFSSYVQILQGTQPWSIDEFNEARAELHQEFPTSRALFEFLIKQGAYPKSCIKFLKGLEDLLHEPLPRLESSTTQNFGYIVNDFDDPLLREVRIVNRFLPSFPFLEITEHLHEFKRLVK